MSFAAGPTSPVVRDPRGAAGATRDAAAGATAHGPAGLARGGRDERRILAGARA